VIDRPREEIYSESGNFTSAEVDGADGADEPVRQVWHNRDFIHRRYARG